MGRFSKILAAVLVLVAIALGSYAWLLAQKSARPPTPVVAASQPPVAAKSSDATTAVVVAAHDLAAAQSIRAEDLKVVAMPQRPADSFASPQALIGQILLSPVGADAPLTRGALATSVASQLLAGERAMAVAVDELNGVGHRIVPGDRVDVFVSLKPERSIGGDDNKAYEGQSRLIVSSLRVLGYGAASLGDPVEEGEASDASRSEADTSSSRRSSSSRISNDNAQPRRAASSAVLAVPVEQINVLAQAAQGGRLLLVLRNPIDSQVADASLFPKPASVLAIRADLDDAQKAALADPVNVAYAGLDAPNLGGSIASPKPPRATTRTQAAPRRTLEVIRGDQRHQATY